MRGNVFIKLTRPDGQPVWIAANTITRVSSSDHPGAKATVHFDDDDLQEVKESPEEIVRLIEDI